MIMRQAILTASPWEMRVGLAGYPDARVRLAQLPGQEEG